VAKNEREMKEMMKNFGKICEEEETKWGGDFRRRMTMFESMIGSKLMCGAEIWGWKEQKEKVQEKCLREVLGVDTETPD
jgi:hypothetical protein